MTLFSYFPTKAIVSWIFRARFAAIEALANIMAFTVAMDARDSSNAAFIVTAFIHAKQRVI